MRGLLNRGRTWLAVASTGGSLLVLEGCDPNVRDTVLGGVEGASQSLITTFIQAFFESLNEPEDGTTTTVKAILPGSLPVFGQYPTA